MPSVLAEAMFELGIADSWPEDAKLYQPEMDQIILPEKASCLSVETILKMTGLDYENEKCTNAIYMSPSGEVPFLKCGDFLISGVESIINFVLTKISHKAEKNKSDSQDTILSAALSNADKADMKAYISLVNVVLHYAELYISWYDKPTFSEVTKPRFGSVFPWPLNHIICWKTKSDVKKKLKSADWHLKTLDEVYEEVNNCCHALSERLKNRKYFFGERPTELDAIVFGHIFGIIETPLPDNHLSNIVREYDNLIDLCGRIQKVYFEKPILEDNDFLNEDYEKIEHENNDNENFDIEKIELET